MTRYARLETPLGTMAAIAEDGKLVALDFEDAKYASAIEPDWIEDPAAAPLRDCAAQLAEYFKGERGRFDLPLAARGTPFQQRVWREIAKVPFGETITYAELAARAGSPGSARAAGAATGRNPIAIVVPCHRIVGANGSLTGYAGGLPRKERLLTHEGALEGAAA
ncbi:MAG TPA: methylated-DNA--[protein]-cysteine S-methyltransferase [Usitatibacteraceae bacterium]|nr:methylated-DNA--[protein]-cysteine S-methyltransferase [Usitatibacteraceae bacterium]